MKSSVKAKAIIIDAICWLYILLFVYAAVSKLIDYEHFTIEIAKSPLLGALANIVPISVIAVELFASVLLLLNKYRFWGLAIAFALMVSFTIYIVIILNWSSFIPCSCGGILSDLGWWEHLAFNLIFLLLAAAALAIHPAALRPVLFRPGKKLYGFIILLFLLASLLVFALYYVSEDKIHRNNAFIRRYPHDPTVLWKSVPIKYNSYYIAGEAAGLYYLGNTTAPSHVLIVNPANGIVDTATIALPGSSEVRLYAPKVSVSGPEFYLSDNAEPILFKGNVNDWEGRLYWKGKRALQQSEPCGPNEFAFTTIGHDGSKHVIGVLNTDKGETQFSENILASQSSEIFDTDGMLHYNPTLQKIIYLYYYRNEFLTCNGNLQNVVSGIKHRRRLQAETRQPRHKFRE